MLRNLAHRYRNWLSVADRRDHPRVRRALARKNAELEGATRRVVFDLRDPRGDREKGRYAYGLVREFVDGGWGAYLADDYWFLSSFHRKAHKRLLLDEPVGLDDGEAGRGVDLLVTDRTRSPVERRARRVLHVDYRARVHAPPPPPAGCVLFPYRPHPNFVQALGRPGAWPEAGDGARPVGLSFLGHWRHRHYDNRADLEEFGVHSRRELVEALRDRFADGLAWASRDEPLPDGGATVLLGRDEALPRQADYARALRASRFFLACPGTAFPTCHSLVEAMLAGCVPILERPEHSGLPLEPGRSCLTFDDLDGLEDAVRGALALDAGRVRDMRAEVATIVERHLAPGAFTRALDRAFDGAGHAPKSLALLWFERRDRFGA